MEAITNFFVRFWSLIQGIGKIFWDFLPQWIALGLVVLGVALILKKSKRYSQYPRGKAVLIFLKDVISKIFSLIFKSPIILLLVIIAVLMNTNWIRRLIESLLGKKPPGEVTPETSVVEFEGSVELSDDIKETIKNAEKLRKQLQLPPPITVYTLKNTDIENFKRGKFSISYKLVTNNPYCKLIYLEAIDQSFTLPLWVTPGIIEGIYANENYDPIELIVKKEDLQQTPEEMKEFIDLTGMTIDDILQ